MFIEKLEIAQAPPRRTRGTGYSQRAAAGAHRAPERLHHITAITADARACERFYAGLLGLERVEPRAGHDGETIAFASRGDDASAPVLSFLVRPDAQAERHGNQSASTVLWRVSDRRELRALWEVLAIAGQVRVVAARRPLGEEMLRFWDPDGLCHEVVVDGGADARVDHSTIHEWDRDPGDSRGQAVRPGRVARLLNRLLCSEDARLVDPWVFRSDGAKQANGRSAIAPGVTPRLVGARANSAGRGRSGGGSSDRVAWAA